MRAAVVVLLACASLLAAAQGLGHLPLWPLPRSVTTGGPALVPLSPFFAFTTSSSSSRLARAMARYSDIVSLNEEGGRVQLEEATISVASADETLNSSTSYAYSLAFNAAASSTVQISADTVYGAMYAMVSCGQHVAPPPAWRAATASASCSSSASPIVRGAAAEESAGPVGGVRAGPAAGRASGLFVCTPSSARQCRNFAFV